MLSCRLVYLYEIKHFFRKHKCELSVTEISTMCKRTKTKFSKLRLSLNNYHSIDVSSKISDVVRHWILKMIREIWNKGSPNFGRYNNKLFHDKVLTREQAPSVCRIHVSPLSDWQNFFKTGTNRPCWYKLDKFVGQQNQQLLPH